MRPSPQEPKERITLTLPGSVIEKLKEKSESEGRSISNWLTIHLQGEFQDVQQGKVSDMRKKPQLLKRRTA